MKKERGPGILLAGYYGFENAGDELILESITSELRRRLPSAGIKALIRPGSSPAASYICVNRYSPVKVVSALFSSDILLLGGGSLLQDSSGPFTLYYYLGLIWFARITGKKTVVFNQGLGPFSRPLSRRMAAFTLKGAELVILRDADSGKIFERLCPGAGYMLGADPVFGYDPERVRKKEPPMPTAVFSLRRWKSLPLMEAASAAADKLREKGYRCLSVPLNRGLDSMGGGIEEISWETPGDIFEYFSGASVVAAGRLHALVAAVICGVPAVGLSYDPKISSFCEYMGIPFIPADSVTSGELYRAMLRAADSGGYPVRKLGALRERLKESWEALESFILASLSD